MTGMQAAGGPLDFDPRVTRALFDLDLAAGRGSLTRRQVAGFRGMLPKDAEIRMYHGTSTRHPVWSKGLLPTSATRRRSIQSGSGFVYLSYDPMRALGAAQMGYPGDGPFVVYGVTVPVRRLRPDPDQLRNKVMWTGRTDIGGTLADSMIHGGGARIRGKVEPWRIGVHGYFDQHGQQTARPDRHEWAGS